MRWFGVEARQGVVRRRRSYHPAAAANSPDPLAQVADALAMASRSSAQSSPRNPETYVEESSRRPTCR